MNSSARRARRLLRSARRGPWGNGKDSLFNAMEPVYALDEDGNPYIRHYKLVVDPWYVSRHGFYRAASFQRYELWSQRWYNRIGPKARQIWIKEHNKAAAWEIGHALSTCCGWGNEESYGGQPQPYPFLSGSVPPEPNPDWRRVVKQKRHRRNR